jgi:hypothetical protein
MEGWNKLCRMANQNYLLEMKNNVTSPNDFVVATIKK